MSVPRPVPSDTATATSVLRVVACEVGDRVGQTIPVSDRLTIGRDPGCEIVLDDSTVSRRHAAVDPIPGGLRVTDLGSGNGVWVGSKRVQEAVLASAEQFRIGSTVFECLHVPAPAPVHLPAPTDPTTVFAPPPQRAPAAAPVAAVRRPFIVRVLQGARPGAEYVVDSGDATVGRSPDCGIVLEDKDVSRKHARIESTADGFLVTDAGSSYGLWAGSTQVKALNLRPGEQFQLAQTVTLECVWKDAPVEAASPDATMYVAPRARVAPAAPAARSTEPTPAAEPSKAMQPGPAKSMPPAAPAGTAPKPPPPAAPAAHTAPAAPAAVPAARVAASKSDAAPRVEPSRPTEGVTDADFSHTVVMRAPPRLEKEKARGIDQEGQLADFLAHKPVLIDDPEHVWIVTSGGVLLFTVAVENGQPVGTRTHFLGILPGQCFFGFDIAGYGLGSGFLAVAKQGTKVRKISCDRLRALAADPAERPAIAGLIDAWIGGLSSALVAGLPLKRSGERQLQPGQAVELGTDTKATSAEGLVWVAIQSGSVMFDDMATPTFTRRRALFPVTPQSWIQALGAEFGALAVTPARTEDVLSDRAVWDGLEVFHQALCESEFINKKLATVDEYVRLQQKAQQSDAAVQAGFDAIGSVMRTAASTPEEFRATGGTDSVVRACALVAAAAGVELRENPSSDEQLTFEDRVAIIASSSGFRTRVVAFRDDWWRRDQGPVLAQISATKEAVALLPAGARSYNLIDPRTGSRQAVTPEIASTLAGFGYTLYRPLPEGTLGVGDVVKFGTRGLARDLRWVGLMAVIVGLFGTVTPYLTGQVFDTAVPQADRNMLYGFGAALLASALASSMFKLTQGIATVRIQARMGSSIQAAVWDRIMNLPVNFFRKYSAGDLSDRAEGVDAIQELVSGAGVAAVLGSVSGLFYVGQMFSYDLRLAMIAILLTVTFVGVNMTCNYLQLKSQRLEIQMRGRISGLVLNLVTGVSKLRICGAEQHAFRVWAEQFAQQRKITFTVGTIQNIATVFASVFPIVSMIAIFTIVIGAKPAPGTPGMTTGEFIAFNACYGLFLAAMQALGDASLNLLRIVPIYERLSPILTTQPEVDKSKAFPGKLTGAIELSHVHFRYDPEGPYIVKDVSLKIQSGEFVAFVGSSGCGKSTLMRLMLGFESPSSGSIYFDGQDLPSLDLRMVRQQMGVVMQQSRVMPTEVFRNIVGATSRTLEEAWEAAEKSGLAEDIRNMPMGMHTYVSEGGGTLSGGQRQRLMIARAIVNKPKIIFLDEATSALDNRTQGIVTESMDKMSATRIVIAHRLSTIQNANRICYLQGGQIMEMGSYQELMDKNGLFAELARRQVV